MRLSDGFFAKMRLHSQDEDDAIPFSPSAFPLFAAAS
jgi:hypothetical protein